MNPQELSTAIHLVIPAKPHNGDPGIQEQRLARFHQFDHGYEWQHRVRIEEKEIAVLLRDQDQQVWDQCSNHHCHCASLHRDAQVPTTNGDSLRAGFPYVPLLQ
jgi:hypothetical protein